MAKRPVRQIRVEGNIAYIPLTKGYKAVIDTRDVDLVEGFNWSAAESGRNVYALRRVRVGDKWSAVWMHRLIMNAPNGMDIDHISGCGLDNRRSNLRVASRAENSRNAKLAKNNTSGYKGVSWDKWHKKWRAYIMVNRKKRHLGVYVTAEDAHAAYCAASEELHGEFGRVD